MYDDGKLDSIRNPDGIWINTQCFREAGFHFMKYGYYTPDPWGSPAWFDYWMQERDRCINGYSVGGARITGEHYFYLNYCPIQKVEDTTQKKSSKIKGFPDFWDGDYNYFWVREIAKQGVFDAVLDDEESKEAVLKLDSEAQAIELKRLFESLHLEVKIEVDFMRGGWNLIVGKSRRKGYSYKNSSTAVRNYYTKPGSLTIFNAYEKKFLYPQGIMTMSINYINFINANTGWAMPSDVVQRTDHIKASYIEYKNGIKLEQGFLSQIMALTCKDNPDANRGKDAEEIIVEESGAFGTPGLLKALYAASQDCVLAGGIKTGLITIFGTSGDMEGGTVDYADMFQRPKAFGLLPFNNIWDNDSEKMQVGFFHPVNWNMEGFYDAQGNSDVVGARNVELEQRKQLIEAGATSVEIQQRMQEKPLGPSEAFSAVSVNNFPVVELKAQLQKVKANGWQLTKGTPVELKLTGKGVDIRAILDGSAEPITSYHNLPLNKRGCPVIYEYPIENAPKGLYKIGYDPIDQENGTSLAGIVVYKSVHIGSVYHSIVVAEYIGRFEDPDDIDKMAEMLAIMYNTTIMHENMVTGTKNYFRRLKKLHLLALQPDAVISKNVKNSKVARVYGCHMSPQLKDAGERYVKTWLLSILDYDEHGSPIRVIDRIYSIRLLEELISYNRKGNFDLVSSLFMCMFQVQEEELGKVYEEQPQNRRVSQLLELMDSMYSK
jgi:hypothetical protein